jgi:protein phosphatase
VSAVEGNSIKLLIPDPSLVILIGPSGCGKSTFAEKHFLSTEIVSSDVCRALVSDDENNQEVSRDAFDLMYFIARKRLRNRRLTVIDATNVRRESRRRLFMMAAIHGIVSVGIAFDFPMSVCLARNRRRRDRSVNPEVVNGQWTEMQRALEHLTSEEFGRLYIIKSEENLKQAEVKRAPRAG